MQNRKKRICIITHSLGRGGLAIAAANLSIALNLVGYDVYIVTVFKEVLHEYKGKLINMGVYKSDKTTILNRLKRFFILKNEMRSMGIDVFIDLRTRTSIYKEYLINRFFYKEKVIYTIHSGSYSKYVVNSLKNFKKLNKMSLGLVCVSKDLMNVFEKESFKNVATIKNPININEIKKQYKNQCKISGKFILAVGQMNTDVKGFRDLIYAYKNSIAVSKKVKLVIVAEGKEKSKYVDLVKRLGLTSFVVFEGFTQNPFSYFKQAEFYVLSSKNEGFPTVLLESLTCGTPVIAYDCFSGPSEIINHKENGLLVKNQDIEELSKAIDVFIENDDLRKYCKSNAEKSVEKYSFDNIGIQWGEYLDKLNI